MCCLASPVSFRLQFNSTTMSGEEVKETGTEDAPQNEDEKPKDLPSLKTEVTQRESSVSNDDGEEDALSAAPIVEKRESHAPQVDVNQLHGEPDFAAICSFFNRFGVMIGLKPMSFTKLESLLTSFDDDGRVNKELFDLHLTLMRRIKMTSVRAETWEPHLKKFLALNESLQGELFQLERYGYIHLPVATKIQILKALCEAQFDANPRMKESMLSTCKATDLRLIPVGFDKNGLAYWFQQDFDYNIRVYTEEADDLSGGTWNLIVRSSEELDALIAKLKSEDLGYVKKELDAKQKAKQPVPEEGSMILSTKKGTFLDTCYDDVILKKMREALVKQKEARRNKLQGKEESEKEPEDEEEEEEQGELDRRLMPRRSAASRAASNIKKFISPSKRGPKKPKPAPAEEDSTEKDNGEGEEGEKGTGSSGDSSSGSEDDDVISGEEEESEEEEEDEFKPKSERKSKGKKRRRKKKNIHIDEEELAEDSDEEEVKKERKMASGEASCGQCKKSGDWDVLLLCDVCDDAWHTYCLKPMLWFVPDGDWFCPKCVHGMLIDRLEEVAKCLDGHLKKKAVEDKKRKAAADRLKREMDFIGVSLNNIIPSGAMKPTTLLNSSSSSSESDVDDGQRKCKRKAVRKIAPRSFIRSKFQMDVQTIAEGRSRRRTTQVDYNFSEYDTVIQEACEELGDSGRPTSREGEIVRPSGGAGRGKDMANIYEAENKRTGSVEEGEEGADGETLQRKVGQPARSTPKVRRKLNDLNVDNGEESDSEEYQANESEVEEADAELPLSGSDYVPSEEERRTRRSTRRGVFAPTQSDEEFVVSGSDESDFGYRGRKKRKVVVEKKKKKKRGRWASDSESEEEEEESDGYSDDSEAERKRKKKEKATGGRGRAKWGAREEEEEEEEEDELDEVESEDEDKPRTKAGRPLRKAVVQKRKAKMSDSEDDSEEEEEEDEDIPKKKKEERPVGALDRPRRAQIESESDEDEFKPAEEEEEDEEDEEEEEMETAEKETKEEEEKDAKKEETQTRKRPATDDRESEKEEGADSGDEDEEDDGLSLIPKKRRVDDESPKEQKPVIAPATATPPTGTPNVDATVLSIKKEPPTVPKDAEFRADPVSELKPIIQPAPAPISTAPAAASSAQQPPVVQTSVPTVSYAQPHTGSPYAQPPNPYYQGRPGPPGMTPYSMAGGGRPPPGYPPFAPPPSAHWPPVNPYAPSPIGSMPSNPYAPVVHNPYGQPPTRPSPNNSNLKDLQSL